MDTTDLSRPGRRKMASKKGRKCGYINDDYLV
jgi:hypothetical protein